MIKRIKPRLRNRKYICSRYKLGIKRMSPDEIMVWINDMKDVLGEQEPCNVKFVKTGNMIPLKSVPVDTMWLYD